MLHVCQAEGRGRLLLYRMLSQVKHAPHALGSLCAVLPAVTKPAGQGMNEWMRCHYGLHRQLGKTQGNPSNKRVQQEREQGTVLEPNSRGLMATNTLACGTRHARALLLKTG